MERDHLDLAGNLLIGGACPRCLDLNGNSPLHLAAAQEDENFVRVLLRMGAWVNAVNSTRQYPLEVAVRHNHLKVAVVLLKAGAHSEYGKKSSLLSASRDVAMTRALLQHGANVKAIDDNGFTPLHSAAMKGRPDDQGAR